ncbi:RNA 2',3'-cyclic phosphodiesterase [Marinobacterium aestuariivivens]|uniref:RNA 2',3'-cyclic phosphodiesterase n=1 Tax=Marinobacterium aestuariivivens TaxID=1698799 RepID=A0ABW2A7V3_9GAMM
MRLFVAIDLPGELQDTIAGLQIPVRHLKWTPPEHLHITLQFLGDQPDQRLPDIFEALETVEFEPMTLCCQGIGQFRSGVIWLGIDQLPALEQLQRRIQSALRQVGIQGEQRRFHAHVTLGRCDRHRLIPVLERVAEQFYGRSFRFDCDTFCLKSSILRPSGALHRVEALFGA